MFQVPIDLKFPCYCLNSIGTENPQYFLAAFSYFGISSVNSTSIGSKTVDAVGNHDLYPCWKGLKTLTLPFLPFYPLFLS